MFSVGAYKHPGTSEIMYLVDWVNYDGPQKVEWLPNRDVGEHSSLDDRLIDEQVTVWWGHEGAAGVHTLRTATPYQGVVHPLPFCE